MGRTFILREDARVSPLRPRKTSPESHITRLAQRRLQSSAYQQLRDVKCSLQDGALVLDGQVSSFYMKQVAQTTVLELVDRFPQVERIDNRLHVPGC